MKQYTAVERAKSPMSNVDKHFKKFTSLLVRSNSPNIITEKPKK